MKKTILTLAIAVMAMMPATISAQAQCKKGNTCAQKCQQQCTKGKHADKKACNPFEGINLTQKQQESLKAIPCPAQVMKDTRKQCADSAKCDRNKARELRKNTRENYLKQVKTVLSAEQYTQFLENYYKNQHPQRPDHKKGMKGKGHGKHRR